MVAAAPMSFCVGPLPVDMRKASTCGQPPSSGTMMGGFMANIISPIMSCWQPPINACVTPSRPMQRNPPPTMVSPVVDRYRQGPQPDHNRGPHANDVLCGRGGSSNRHVGNLNFRSLVAANKEMYVTLTKKQKMMVARKIVETIHLQEPPGRFLQKDLTTGMWFDIGVPRSLEKTSQALREKTSAASPDDALSDIGTDPGTDIGTDPGTDPGCHSPTPVSPISTAHSSPVASSTATSKGKPIAEIPDICIPHHLEAQFRPQSHVLDARTTMPGPPPSSWDYPPPPQQPYLHPYPPPAENAYSHYPPPHPGYTSGPPPHPYDHHRDYRQHYRQPYPQPYHHQSHPPQPHPHPQAYHPRHPHPYPPVTSSGPIPYHSAHPIPLSPERRPSYRPTSTPENKNTRTTSTSSGHPTSHHHTLTQSSAQRPSQHTSTVQRSNREKAEISPSRAQAVKKPRHHSPTNKAVPSSSASTSSLSRDMQHRLTFEDRGTIISPTSLSQSRDSVRRSKDSRSNPLAGLAALSSAALMKLDEGVNYN